MVPIWGSAHSSLVGIITACTSGWPDNFFVVFLWQTPIPISRTLINERIRGKSRVSFLKIARMFYSWFSVSYIAHPMPVTLSHAFSQVSRAWRGQGGGPTHRSPCHERCIRFALFKKINVKAPQYFHLPANVGGKSEHIWWCDYSTTSRYNHICRYYLRFIY